MQTAVCNSLVDPENLVDCKQHLFLKTKEKRKFHLSECTHTHTNVHMQVYTHRLVLLSVLLTTGQVKKSVESR